MKVICSFLLIFIFTGNGFAQFQLDTSKLALFGKGELSLSQKKRADSLLVEAVNYYNSKTDARPDSVVSYMGEGGHIQLSEYYRQYQFSIDKKGGCFIKVSCFCSSVISNLDKVPKENKIDWRKHPLEVYDGGNCIFKINLDLKNNKASMMRVNGI